MTTNLYDHDTEVQKLGIDVPPWISPDITASDIAAILEGGCASGAYMPAVTYYDAAQTMGEHGDDVLDYIENVMGELPSPRKGESWSGMAVHYLSCAVELWCSSVEDEVREAIDNANADDDESEAGNE